MLGLNVLMMRNVIFQDDNLVSVHFIFIGV